MKTVLFLTYALIGVVHCQQLFFRPKQSQVNPEQEDLYPQTAKKVNNQEYMSERSYRMYPQVKMSTFTIVTSLAPAADTNAPIHKGMETEEGQDGYMNLGTVQQSGPSITIGTLLDNQGRSFQNNDGILNYLMDGPKMQDGRHQYEYAARNINLRTSMKNEDKKQNTDEVGAERPKFNDQNAKTNVPYPQIDKNRHGTNDRDLNAKSNEQNTSGSGQNNKQSDKKHNHNVDDTNEHKETVDNSMMDKWVWDMNEPAKVTKSQESSIEPVKEDVTLDDRSNFQVSTCPSGYKRVAGKCVQPI